MKILCISDQIDPLVYTNSIKERFKDIDIVLSAGDLPLDYLEFVVSSLNIPLLFVFGNHNVEELSFFMQRNELSLTTPVWDDGHPASSLGCIHIGSKVRLEGGLIIAGLGGSMRYNQGVNQYTNAQMNFEIIKLIPRLIFNRLFHGRYLDILLTHAPPLGIHDKPDLCHRGFSAFLWFMRVFRPRYLIHGHIHLYDLSELRVSRYQETTVINAYSHYVFDTKEGL
ncbi:MAG: metallophosphoesterase [Spirochaetaceae bacterium]|jgi:Icc-related predicted phosphoesterase|nr:metallophosphoesterase [Spirochaetaceae bacterium]